MKGRQKAAVLLVSLGPERAAELLSHLHEEEMEAITLEMAKMRQVAAETTEAVMTEVVETTAAIDFVGHGGFDYARDVLEKSVGPARAAEMMGGCPPSSTCGRSSSCAARRPSRSAPSSATRRRRRWR